MSKSQYTAFQSSEYCGSDYTTSGTWQIGWRVFKLLRTPLGEVVCVQSQLNSLIQQPHGNECNAACGRRVGLEWPKGREKGAKINFRDVDHITTAYVHVEINERVGNALIDTVSSISIIRRGHIESYG